MESTSLGGKAFTITGHLQTACNSQQDDRQKSDGIITQWSLPTLREYHAKVWNGLSKHSIIVLPPPGPLGQAWSWLTTMFPLATRPGPCCSHCTTTVNLCPALSGGSANVHRTHSSSDGREKKQMGKALLPPHHAGGQTVPCDACLHRQHPGGSGSL